MHSSNESNNIALAKFLLFMSSNLYPVGLLSRVLSKAPLSIKYRTNLWSSDKRPGLGCVRLTVFRNMIGIHGKQKLKSFVFTEIHIKLSNTAKMLF